MKSWSWLAGLLGCCLLLGCGAHAGAEGDSPSERASSRAAELVLPPQVSPDFALDQEQTAEPDQSGAWLAIASSTAAGYMLLYRVPYAPEPWSRFTTHGNVGSAYATDQLAVVLWGASGGAPSTLTRLPIFGVTNARAMDVGSGWLIVYDDPTGRHTVVVARDGSFSPPKAVLGTCGMVDFARSATTALLTDSCNNGTLFDFAGQMLTAITFPKPAEPTNLCWNLNISGGQLAFNGIDYLVMFDCVQYYQKGVLGYVVSPAGDVGPSAMLISQPMVPYKGVKFVNIAGNSNGTFLVVLAQDKSSGPEHAITYRRLSETAQHVFSYGTEQTMPGEMVLNDGLPSDSSVSVAEFGSDFALTRTRSTGVLDLVRPNVNGSGVVTTQLLAPLSGSAYLFPDDQFAGATRLMMITSAGITRLTSSAAQIDVPPASVFPSKQRGQYAASLAFDGLNYLASWTEAMLTVPAWSTGNAPQIFGHRLSATGALLDSSSFGISPVTDVAVTPLVAANPNQFSAAWNSATNFLTGAATITDVNPPVLARYPSPGSTPLEFGLATDGSKTTVAWSTSTAVFTAQLGSTGTWSTPLTIGSLADATATAPALVFNTGKYLVLWTAAANSAERALYATRVSTANTPLDLAPKEVLRFASPAVSDASVDTGIEAVACGDHFVVAWTTIVGPSEELRIARVSDTLTLLDPGGILVGSQAYPVVGATSHRFALGWDGSNVWVVWRDNEGGARRPSAGLRGRRFSETLAAVDSDSFSIATDLDEYSKVTLAHGAADSSMVGYTRYLASAGSFRARARFLSASSFADGMPCTSASQCQSGVCSSGACWTATGSGGSTGVGGTGGSAGVGIGGEGGGGGIVGIGGTTSVGGSIGAGGMIDVAGTGGTVGVGGTIDFAGSGGVGGGAGISGSAASGGNAGVAGNVSVGGNAGLGGSSGTSGGTETGGSAGTGGNAGISGSGGNAEVAGASEGGASGALSGEGGEATGGQPTGSAGKGAVAGQAGTAGSPSNPPSPSCDCRTAGAGSTSRGRAPALFGALIAIAAALFRRRTPSRARRRRAALKVW